MMSSKELIGGGGGGATNNTSFKSPSVLVNYESAYDQEVFTQYGPNGPTLDFVVSGDNRNCIDMNYIHLSLVASIYDKDGRDSESV